MCSDCWFTGAVTTGYKIHSAGEAVTPGYKINSVGGAVSTGHKTGSANFVPGRDKTSGVNFVPTGDKTDDGNLVSTGYKIRSAGEAVTTGYKIHSAGEAVSGGHKTGSVNFVPGREKTAAVDSVSGGYKTDAAAMTASAKYMDACAGAAWMLFAVTARDGMAWTVAGRGTFAVTGCFLLLPFGMRCAGCADVVMNSFFACRDDFIFSQFVISFLPLKEPLRVRGIFLCWRFYEY